ncbi:hypothetical protein NUU61_007627 [Penicillium alfredii]|uniref:Uncharacterized protein n=1 Tax=Penicillium alfredii TaxID=1506179 RepID=A0A9W9ER21_9EURO|nr:uncharacterized protein NUU61_007627 [Penicillium alfredii]KAJ5086320.1 hypothetical protein NUU61_007627 [Penicillium alfredii]
MTRQSRSAHTERKFRATIKHGKTSDRIRTDWEKGVVAKRAGGRGVSESRSVPDFPRTAALLDRVSGDFVWCPKRVTGLAKPPPAEVITDKAEFLSLTPGTLSTLYRAIDSFVNMDTRKPTSSQRLPPPALFQGPPSHNASNISLSAPPAASSLATPSGSQPPPLHRNISPGNEAASADNRSLLSPFVSRHPSKNDVDGSDAIWEEMQSALSEVELSAVTSEHVFGEKHSEALEDLRMKQLKLAQAWARSEADEIVDSSHNPQDKEGAAATAAKRQGSVDTNTADATTEQSANRDGVSYRVLDEETEKDIIFARKRREANDRYFDRVNHGVLDVVAKLEEVAQAMRTVERESKDIWSDSDSVTTTAPSTNTG